MNHVQCLAELFLAFRVAVCQWELTRVIIRVRVSSPPPRRATPRHATPRHATHARSVNSSSEPHSSALNVQNLTVLQVYTNVHLQITRLDLHRGRD